MKVVFITMFRENMGGGVGRVAHEIAPAFAKKHETLFVCPGWETNIKKTGNLTIFEIEAEGKKEIAIPNLSPKNIKRIFKELKIFSPEIVHAQDPGPLSFLVQIWAKKNNIPFVYTSHVLPTKTSEFNVKEMSNTLGKLFENKLIKKYFLNFFKNCEAVIALNRDAEKDIRKFGYKGKIYPIPNGRDLSLYKKEKKFSKKKEKILLFVGYVTKRKNQKYLIDTMKYLPKTYILKLAGPAIDEKYLDSLTDYCQKNQLSNVEFLGKVPYLEVSKLLLDADIFVSASKMEVQSLAIIEALASGTPVVGLFNETINELVNSENGIVLSKKTFPKEFAKKIKEIGDLPKEKYLLLSNSARMRVEGLDWAKVVDKTVEHYKEIILDKLSIKKTASKNNFLGSFNFFGDIKFETDIFKKVKISGTNYKEDFNILVLAVATLMANNFYSFWENLNELLEKIKK